VASKKKKSTSHADGVEKWGGFGRNEVLEPSISTGTNSKKEEGEREKGFLVGRGATPIRPGAMRFQSRRK